MFRCGWLGWRGSCRGGFTSLRLGIWAHEVTTVLRVLGLTLLVAVLSSSAIALLSRDMRFMEVA